MMKKYTKRTAARSMLKEILNFYPISEGRAFKIANVHRTTWKRWLNGESNPHPAVIELIRLHALGEPPDPAFAGCRFVNGVLYDDHGNAHTLGDLRVFSLYKQHHFQYMALLKKLSREESEREAEKEKGRVLPHPPRLRVVK